MALYAGHNSVVASTPFHLRRGTDPFFQNVVFFTEYEMMNKLHKPGNPKKNTCRLYHNVVWQI
jgi:hypothetical protein